jgi:hypothetical protein
VGLNSHEGGFHENQNECLSLISDIDPNSSAGLFLIRQLNISFSIDVIFEEKISSGTERHLFR